MKVQVMTKGCLPYKKHQSDAGFDLKSTERKLLMYMESHTFDTGIRVEIPFGHCGLVIPRSGKGVQGAVLKNTVGVIDSDYRGNIFVNIKNVSEFPLVIEQYERFAQLIIVPIHLPNLEVVDDLSNTARGDDGFGKSGKY